MADVCSRAAVRGGMMLSALVRVLLIVLVAVTLTGCAVVGGIFKAGFWVGVVIAVIVIGGLVALFSRG